MGYTLSKEGYFLCSFQILCKYQCIANAEVAVMNLVATQAALRHREAEHRLVNSFSVAEVLDCFCLAKRTDSTDVEFQEKLKQTDMDSLGMFIARPSICT